jgi:hypothetical protein
MIENIHLRYDDLMRDIKVGSKTYWELRDRRDELIATIIDAQNRLKLKDQIKQLDCQNLDLGYKKEMLTALTEIYKNSDGEWVAKDLIKRCVEQRISLSDGCTRRIF